jgi:hypothetical protein
MAELIRMLKGSNWKTSAAAVVGIVFGFVAFSPEHFQQWPWLISLAKYVMLGGLASIGIMAKDSTNHSTLAQVKESTKEASVDALAEAEDKKFR